MKKNHFILFAILTSSVLFSMTIIDNKRKEFNYKSKIIHNDRSILPVWDPEYQTAELPLYRGTESNEKELENIQCPIPKKDRVKNYTGIQCVFSSLECLGRWAECKALIDPPITGRSDCQKYSSPTDASNKLNKLGVKFEMSYRDRERGIILIKKAMNYGRGVLFGVPGHAMVLCHYDEENKIVKYINNSNANLPIETMSLDEFNRQWDTWVIMIYAEKDLFPFKANNNIPNALPIIDRNNPQKNYNKNYIPIPSKDD